MEKKLMRQKLIDEFKSLNVKYEAPKKARRRTKTRDGREIKIFLNPEKANKPIVKPKTRSRNDSPLLNLAKQYMEARKQGDDVLAEYVFRQIAHLD